MGFFDALKGKKKEPEAGNKGAEGRRKEEAERQRKKEAEAPAPQGKYNEACSLCGSPGTEKKWMGQFWHKKCLRQMKKGARKMV